MDKYASALALVGRLALAGIFVIFGFTKISGFAGMVAYASSVGVPFPELAIAIAIIVELLGGIMLVIGFKTKWVALAITLFLIPVTYYFHTDFTNPVNMIMLWKNVSIIGGMLVLAANGAGKYSLDSMLAKKSY
ncbi:MAG: DoxX family protein [Candidatus Paceibacterota bacterium]